jgi:hypothetical protein
MKLPKHLEERRDELAILRSKRQCSTGQEDLNKAISFYLKVGFEDGYDAAVADMFDEIEPLVGGAKEYVASNFECRDAKLINAFRSWQKKFGGEG